jgi:transcriptional regulator with XRE-family HTH domain
MITILGANGVTQAEIAALMGKTTQGRLSEYKMHKRAPTMETFKKFADGLGLPPAARLALGLASEAADSGLHQSRALRSQHDTLSRRAKLPKSSRTPAPERDLGPPPCSGLRLPLERRDL